MKKALGSSKKCTNDVCELTALIHVGMDFYRNRPVPFCVMRKERCMTQYVF